MERMILDVLKFTLIVLSMMGAIFHLSILKKPGVGRKVEEKLGTELGVKKLFIPWLEKNRMQLHERLIKSKTYNMFAAIFLIILLILLFQI